MPGFAQVDDTVKREDHLSDGGLAELGDHSPRVGVIGEPLNGCKDLPNTPLTFLGGTFYFISMLPPVWQTVTLFNPVVYLVSSFRWSFYGISDIHVGVSLGMIALFMLICPGLIGWVLKTWDKLKN